MNLVGKILTVLIFVMCVVFMALTAAVYSAHTNWKEEAAEWKGKADAKEKENQEKEEQRAQLEKTLAREQAAKSLVVAGLDTKLIHDQTRNQELVKQLETVEQSNRAANGAVEVAVKQAAISSQQVDDIEQKLIVAQRDRDAHFKQVRHLTNQLHVTSDKLRRAEDLNKKIMEQYVQAKKVILHYNLDENDPLTGPPDGVEGVVLAVQAKMVQISIGTDDGIRKGHTLYVSRGSATGGTYLGEIQVVDADADKCICKITKSLGAMQRGDRVHTTLQ